MTFPCDQMSTHTHTHTQGESKSTIIIYNNYNKWPEVTVNHTIVQAVV